MSLHPLNRHIIGLLLLLLGLVAETSGQQKRFGDTVGRGMPDYLKTDPAKYWRHFASRPKQVHAAGHGQRAGSSSTFHTLGAFSVTYTTTPANCGEENGSVVLLPSGGTAPYLYSFEGQPYQSNAFWIEFPGFTFFATVKDATGATVTVPISIPDNKPQVFVQPIANGTPVVGCDLANGVITLQGADGVPPYSYSVDQVNWQSSPNFTNLPPGDYTFFIKDAEGCTGQFSSPLGDGAGCDNHGYLFSDGYSDCGAPGTVYCIPQQVPGPLQYSIDGGTTWQSDPNFTEYAGQYDITIKDGNGKLYLFRCFVYSECPIMVNISSQDAACGNNDGQITVSASNGTPPYQFSLDGIHFQSSGNFTGLAAGTYSVVVMDAGGTVRLYSGQVINSGCPVLTATAANATCGNSDGSITASVTGGVAPYSYSKNGGAYQGSPTFASLAPGSYLITVQDGNGNTSSVTITVGNSCLQLTAIPGNIVCSQPDGTITITGAGGTPPYAYSRDGVVYQSGNVFSGLGAGNYTVYIKDATSTPPASTGVTITDQPGPTAIMVTATAAGCDLTGGGLTAVVAGGTMPYQYSTDGANWQAGNSFSLPSGSYPMYVKDANGCGLSNGPWAIPLLCLRLTAAETDASCTQDDGTITAGASGGTAPYTYSIDGINFQSSPVFSGRPPGSYTVTAKDNGALMSSVPVTVARVCLDLTLTTADAGCTDGQGMITAAVSGGTAPYAYSLDGLNWQTDNAFTPAPGSFTVTARDARGFSVVSPSTTISLVNNLSVDAGADQTICQGSAVRLKAVSNGAVYAWTPAAGLDNAAELAPLASPATTTLYTLQVVSGVCQASATMTVNVNPAPVADAGPDTAICYGQSVQLQGSGGVVYSWSPGTDLNNAGIADPVVMRPKASIVYRLSVTDGLGCRSLQPDEVVVTVTPPPAIALGHDTSILAGQPVYLAVADVNSSGFTSFSWSPAVWLSDPTVADPVANVEASTTYTVMAATPDGCEATASIAIKVYSVAGLFVPNAFTPNGDGHNDVLRVIPVGVRTLKYFNVYDRWGQLVFATQRPGAGWDGTVHGMPAPMGTYVWMAGGVDYKGDVVEKGGVVLLIR